MMLFTDNYICLFFGSLLLQGALWKADLVCCHGFHYCTVHFSRCVTLSSGFAIPPSWRLRLPTDTLSSYELCSVVWFPSDHLCFCRVNDHFSDAKLVCIRVRHYALANGAVAQIFLYLAFGFVCWHWRKIKSIWLLALSQPSDCIHFCCNVKIIQLTT